MNALVLAGLRCWLWQTKTASRIAHQLFILILHGAGAGSAVILQKLLKSKQSVFPNEQPDCLIAARPLMACAKKRLLDHAEIEAAIGVKPDSCVVPEPSLRDQVGTNDACALGHRMIPVTVIVDENRRRQLLHSMNPDLDKRSGIVGIRDGESNCAEPQDWRSDATGFYA